MTSIQTVPALRDVVVDIDGRLYSTDRHGTIQLAGVDPSATVTVLGVQNDPPIQLVDVLGWADGSGGAPRTLDSLTGPVAYLFLELESRVTVVLHRATDQPAAVTFDTEDGAVRVQTETPTWLTDRRGLRGANGPTVVQLHYTVRSIETSDGTTPTEGQVFTATPEARWVIRTASGPQTSPIPG